MTLREQPQEDKLKEALLLPNLAKKDRTCPAVPSPVHEGREGSENTPVRGSYSPILMTGSFFFYVKIYFLFI